MVRRSGILNGGLEGRNVGTILATLRHRWSQLRVICDGTTDTGPMLLHGGWYALLKIISNDFGRNIHDLLAISLRLCPVLEMATSCSGAK